MTEKYLAGVQLGKTQINASVSFLKYPSIGGFKWKLYIKVDLLLILLLDKKSLPAGGPR